MDEKGRLLLQQLAAELGERRNDTESQKKSPVIAISLFIFIIMVVTFLNWSQQTIDKPSYSKTSIQSTDVWPNTICSSDLIVTLDNKPVCPI